MRRFVTLPLAAALLFQCAFTAHSQGPVRMFARSVARDARRTNAWPHPFVMPDRNAVWAPMSVMVLNGWRQQNTLTDAHFKEGGTELNEAGRLKIQWVQSSAPSQYRSMYVQRSGSPEQTAMRMEAVQGHLSEMAVNGPAPAVFEAEQPSPGWSADYADTISRKFSESTPAPRIPVMPSTQGTSSSGS